MPLSAQVNDLQDAALNCYLSSLLAMAKSMSAICSRAGLMHGARLTRLPRRLGFRMHCRDARKELPGFGR